MKPTAYEGKEPFVFASYSHKDHQAVFKVLGELQKRGYRLWYDEGIEPGSEWPEDIARHLESAAVVLAFITPSAMNSDNCRREINFSLSRKKPLLAIALEPTKLSPGMEMQLSTQQMISRQNYDRWDSFIQKILSYPKLEPCRLQQPVGSARNTPPNSASSAAAKVSGSVPSQVRVSFNPAGAVGVGVVEAVVPPGAPVACPSLSSYIMRGYLPEAWCETPNGMGSCHAAGSVVSFTRDTVLYVKWKPVANGAAGTSSGAAGHTARTVSGTAGSATWKPAANTVSGMTQHTARQSAAKQPWYAKTWAIVLILLFLGPFGLILVWNKKCTWSRETKLVATVVMTALTVFAIIGGMANSTSTDTSTAVGTSTSQDSASSSYESYYEGYDSSADEDSLSELEAIIEEAKREKSSEGYGETATSYDALWGTYVTTGYSAGGYLTSASLTDSELILVGDLHESIDGSEGASVGDKTWIFKVDDNSEFGYSADGNFNAQSREEFAGTLESLAFPALSLTIEDGTIVQARIHA